MNGISSNSSSYLDVYAQQMKEEQQFAIGKIEDDIKKNNTSVQNAGNPDYDPNDVDPSDQS